MAKKIQFKTPTIPRVVFSVFVMGMLSITYLAPEKISTKYLPVIGNFLLHLSHTHPQIVAGIFWMTWFIHFLEASYAAWISFTLFHKTANSVCWFIQTFFLGLPSTRLIIELSNQRPLSSMGRVRSHSIQ